MDVLKKLTGLVAGVFLTLIGGWLCSWAFVPNLCYDTINVRVFLPSGGVMSAVMAVIYCLHVAVVARLVTGKHFFPSVYLLIGVELLSALYLHLFFAVTACFAGLVVMASVFALSFVLQVRFFVKDMRIALYYLPILIFNCYALVASTYVALALAL